jgi:peptidoglycan DL-endopeptidase CwlO
VGKHRLQRESSVSRTMRGAVVVGAVGAATVGGAAVSAAPASAATINVPGIGNFEVPDLPALPQLPQFPAPQLPDTFNSLPMPSLPSLSVPMSATVGQKALDAARTKVGAMYAWGGTGPYSFDCSGLVQWAYHQAGINLPRTSYEQMNVGVPVSEENLQPGDIIITNGGGHVTLYAGNGQILHASTAGEPVKYSPLGSQTFYAARRL